MHDIIHILTIKAPVEQVFEQVSQPHGLNRWWTKDCSGRPELGSLYELGFGTVNWQAQVTDFLQNKELEYTLCKCDPDWLDTTVRFELTSLDQSTQLKFAHLAWPIANQHYYTSNHCWGLYLRVLRRYLEFGEETPYEQRLMA